MLTTKGDRKIFCLAAGILGIVLIGLGVFLFAASFGTIITIGTIISGILLLVICSLTRCVRFHCLACLLLLLIGLFLVISGIVTLTGFGLIGFVTGLILIGLGIIALVLATICFILRLCCSDGDKGGPPYLK